MKQTVFNHIRDHIFNRDTLRGRKESEWCVEFENLMRNRLVVGSFRYGNLHRKRPQGITKFHIDYIQRKLKQYKKTGNTEMLVDIANLALVEFVVGDHKYKHFKAEDRQG